MSISENKRRNGDFNVMDYVTSRIARIYPPLLAVFIITSAMSISLFYYEANEVKGNYTHPIVKIFNPDFYAQLLSVLTVTVRGSLGGGREGVNLALWSLEYEIQLYVIACLMAVIFSGKSNIIKLICIILLAVYVKKIGFNFSLNRQSVPFICFFIGFASFHLRKKIRGNAWLVLASIIFTILSIGLICEWTDVFGRLRSHIVTPGMWMFYKIPLSFFFATIIVFSDKVKYITYPFRALSSFSYSIYILHCPVIVFAFFVMDNFFPFALESAYTTTLATVFLCIILSFALSLITEKPRFYKALIERLIMVISLKRERA